MFDLNGKVVVVTGGNGFLGRVLCRLLRERGAEVRVPDIADYDLISEEAVARMYRDLEPRVVFHLAAEVGGIGANLKHPGRFFFANMAMGLHLIEHARINRLERFVQIGTVCAYPKFTPVPFREEDLWNGYPEETNAPYGVAKKSLFVMLDAYQREYGLSGIVVVPVNLFGPNDNFDLESSHVIPALIRKCCEAVDAGADVVPCWGTGTASREFLYVDDAAEGILLAAERATDPEPINLGTGSEIRIRDLAALIAETTGFTGRLAWDEGKPDGQPRRRLDVSRARERLGWESKVDLSEGLRRTIAWFRDNGSKGGA